MIVLHTDFHRGWGGQAARVLMVCSELARLGHRAIVAAPPGELSRRARAAGLEVDDRFSFRPPMSALRFTRDVRRLAASLRDAKVDVLHTHGSQDTWAGAAARSITGRPAAFVATRHNTKPVRFNAANRWLYGRAIDHLILVSESVRANYRPFLDAGLLGGDRISVVHSAYRVEMFHDGVDPEPLRRALGIEGRRPVLGVLARLVEDKGHTWLFRAMAAIRERHPGAILLVAGHGPLEERLRREAAERGLDACVRFLGFRDDVAALTALLDVAVLPSIGCDASSASIKEAMAMARPVVATDVGGAREILDDGLTGLVVPPGDAGALAAAILGLLDDPDRARRMGAAAREAVRRRFGPALLAAGEIAVYERVLAARAAQAAPVSPAAVPGGRRP